MEGPRRLARTFRFCRPVFSRYMVFFWATSIIFYLCMPIDISGGIVGVGIWGWGGGKYKVLDEMESTLERIFGARAAASTFQHLM